MYVISAGFILANQTVQHSKRSVATTKDYQQHGKRNTGNEKRGPRTLSSKIAEQVRVLRQILKLCLRYQ